MPWIWDSNTVGLEARQSAFLERRFGLQDGLAVQTHVVVLLLVRGVSFLSSIKVGKKMKSATEEQNRCYQIEVESCQPWVLQQEIIDCSSTRPAGGGVLESAMAMRSGRRLMGCLKTDGQIL